MLLDDRTLIYTATDDDGTGPWLYLMDLRERTPIRLSSGVEHVISIAASAEVPGKPRRLVATVSNPSVELWSVPIGDTHLRARRAPPGCRFRLRDRCGPRYAPDSSVLYLASRGGADALWRFAHGAASGVLATERGYAVGRRRCLA